MFLPCCGLIEIGNKVKSAQREATDVMFVCGILPTQALGEVVGEDGSVLRSILKTDNFPFASAA